MSGNGGRPTVRPGGRLDLSPSAGHASGAPTSREKAMFDAYRGLARRTEPCACGEDIVAIPQWEEAAVSEHNAGAKHQAWRAWRETV